STYQPPLERPDIRPVEVFGTTPIRPRHARPQIAPEAHRLRIRSHREAKAALLLRVDGAAVPRGLRSGLEAPGRNRRADAANFGDAIGQRRLPPWFREYP